MSNLSGNGNAETTAKAVPRLWPRRLGRAVLIYAVMPYVAVTLLFTAVQRQLLYPGARDGVPADSATMTSPGVRPVELTVADGLVLRGWHYEPHAERDAGSHRLDLDRKKPRERGLVLIFPGNAGNRWDRIHEGRELAAQDADALLFDYRGYGGNSGSPSETALASDAREIWRLANEELGYRSERIVIFGESLGGAVAIRLAAELCREGTSPAGLVVNSTFASLPQTVGWHYPLFPFRYLLWDRYSSIERIGEVTCPLVIVHGTEDDLVPLAQARALFDAAPGRSERGREKRFVELQGVGHNSVPASALREAVDGILAEAGAVR